MNSLSLKNPFLSSKGLLVREKETLFRIGLLKHSLRIKGHSFSPPPSKNFVTRSVVSSASGPRGDEFFANLLDSDSAGWSCGDLDCRSQARRQAGFLFAILLPIPPRVRGERDAWSRVCVRAWTWTRALHWWTKGGRWWVMRDAALYRERRWRLEVPLAWHRRLTLFLHLGEGECLDAAVVRATRREGDTFAHGWE